MEKKDAAGTTVQPTETYTYDLFGRLSQVSSAGKAIARNAYDGYDRIVRHRRLQVDGTRVTRLNGWSMPE